MLTTQDKQYLTTNLHTNKMVYILNLKWHHFKFNKIYSLYVGWNQGPSDPKADDKPMCHRASKFFCKNK